MPKSPAPPKAGPEGRPQPAPAPGHDVSQRSGQAIAAEAKHLPASAHVHNSHRH